MANTNLTRTRTWMLKKTKSLIAEVIVEGTNTVNGEVPVTSGDYLIATLPAGCIITGAYVQVITASNAATTAAAKIGTAEAGSQILSAANLKTLGKQGTFVATQIESGTGLSIYLNLAYAGAVTAAGKYAIVIEYDEYLKNNGEYTGA